MRSGFGYVYCGFGFMWSSVYSGFNLGSLISATLGFDGLYLHVWPCTYKTVKTTIKIGLHTYVRQEL